MIRESTVTGSVSNFPDKYAAQYLELLVHLLASFLFTSDCNKFSEGTIQIFSLPYY